MTHIATSKLRLAALIALGTSLLAAAVPAMAGSPFVASWVWIR